MFARQKEDVGTEKDCEELRMRVNKQMKDLEALGNELGQEIEEYGNISVRYNAQRQQTEKKEAYSKRLNDVVSKFRQE